MELCGPEIAGGSARGLLNRLRDLKHRFEHKAGPFACPAQFAAVGLSGMVLDLFSLWCFRWFLPFAAARALAIWLALSWNFSLNRRITFAYASRQHPIRQYFLYAGSCAAGALGSWTTSVALFQASPFFLANPTLAAIAGVGVGFGLNYCSCRVLVFGSRRAAELPPATESA
jgi:dolichol-phosphate mannosyltransferase